MAEINDRIKERRLAAGKTLLEVSEFLGVKEATAQRYESGEIKNIKHETIVSLAKLFNCSPAYLMGWEADKKEAVNNFPLSDLEKEIITAYRRTDEIGKACVLRTLGVEEKRDSSKMA
ncbi:helix-turn-helix domain-containing protein [Lacrimispora defluvii]|uniref:Helix-turn-helix transcriptional regulator n=1 Tax=Lacrimispora defluvii TaxID=2719233 RepID=A0ABX1VPV2_9FIRM|nr:helix-turn-helix transcriptional regulator [Lacrimispora defluvii]NNJ30129.1 helix-turn-helix transcriptional regulator [Lacrimispora defluvii]